MFSSHCVRLRVCVCLALFVEVTKYLKPEETEWKEKKMCSQLCDRVVHALSTYPSNTNKKLYVISISFFAFTIIFEPIYLVINVFFNEKKNPLYFRRCFAEERKKKLERLRAILCVYSDQLSEEWKKWNEIVWYEYGHINRAWNIHGKMDMQTLCPPIPPQLRFASLS